MTLTPAQRDRLTRAITGHRVDLGYCTTRLGQADASAIVDKLAAVMGSCSHDDGQPWCNTHQDIWHYGSTNQCRAIEDPMTKTRRP